jgi:tRNA(Ile)-lysidine synthase
LAQTAGIAKDHIENLKTELFQKEGDVVKIKIASLLELKPVGAYLHALFNPFGFTEWNDIESLLGAMSGKEVRSATHRLIKHREFVLLRPIRQSSYIEYKIGKNENRIKEPLDLVQETVTDLREVSENIIYVDKDLLQYPLILRKWRQGDRFRPFGIQGAKKVSKFFKDEKMDVFAKENQWLLVSAEDIVWIIGRRADDRFKVTERTRNILKIEVFP